MQDFARCMIVQYRICKWPVSPFCSTRNNSSSLNDTGITAFPVTALAAGGEEEYMDEKEVDPGNESAAIVYALLMPQGWQQSPATAALLLPGLQSAPTPAILLTQLKTPQTVAPPQKVPRLAKHLHRRQMEREMPRQRLARIASGVSVRRRLPSWRKGLRLCKRRYRSLMAALLLQSLDPFLQLGVSLLLTLTPDS